MSNRTLKYDKNSKHSLEKLQDPVDLQGLSNCRGAHVTDVVATEAEGVQHPLELL